MNDEGLAYQETDASALVGEVFGGNLSVPEAIEKLRTRLLDLSSRNRLLSYKFPKGKCFQIIGKPNLNQIFERLMDSKPIRLLPVPDPLPPEFEGKKKPDVRSHAEHLGISVATEFAHSPPGPHQGRRLPGLQLLYYPADMDRLVRKVASEARTAIEETGSNMLFLVVGFLEFYDSDDSDKPMLAPLLSLPATLVKGPVDPETRTYQWSIQHNGEDITENATLKEKLKQFSLHLPDLESEEEPEAYFANIEKAIKSKRRWRVRRQLTIAMLSFGKLAVWADLDPKKHPDIVSHPQIANIFKGGVSSGDNHFFAEDYKVDERSDADISLVYDADSSQHSAIMDVLSGKNVVINGPPGTGKSQTITNLIAAALAGGKKVLFVADKLAALEVVRHRLDQANLGQFCLELHSHKTQKKKFFEDINERLEANFRPPTHFKDRLATLRRQKKDLARHAQLMGSKVGNALDLTIHEVFWACEHRRTKLGELSTLAGNVDLKDAPKWTLDDIRVRREQIEGLAELWITVRQAGTPHPWAGFRPRVFIPGNDDAVARIVSQSAKHLMALVSSTQELSQLLGMDEPTATELLTTRKQLQLVAAPPANLRAGLLSTLFDEADPRGVRSRQLIGELANGLDEARNLRRSAYKTLVSGVRLDPDAIVNLRQRAESTLLSEVLELPLEQFAARSEGLSSVLAGYRSVASSVAHRWSDTSEAVGALLANKLEDVRALDFSGLTIADMESNFANTAQMCLSLENSLNVVEDIVRRRSLTFDDSPAAIARLLEPSATEGLFGETAISDAEMEKANRLTQSSAVPVSASLEAISRMVERIQTLEVSIRESLQRCQEAAERFDHRCEGPTSPEEELRIIVTIAEKAPLDLLRYRCTGLADRGATEAIAKAREAIHREEAMRAELQGIFHLDAVPEASQLRTALTAFRRGDGLFNFLNSEWRQANRVFTSVAKERKKRSAAELADYVTKLLAWIEHREGFMGNQSLPSLFGDLFQGFATEVDKAERLHAWHMDSHTLIVASDNLHSRLDLVRVDAIRLELLAARAGHLKADVERLERCEAELRDILGIIPHGFREARRTGWGEALRSMENIREALVEVVEVLGRRGRATLSPQRIVQLMEARNELDNARSEITALANGRATLRDISGNAFAQLLGNEGTGWRNTIIAVAAASKSGLSLAQFLKDHATPAATITGAVSYLRARLALGEALTVMASIGDQCQGEEQYINFATLAATVSRDVAAAFRGCIHEGQSAQHGFVAVAALTQAESLVEGLERAPETQRVLAGTLNGFDTDCEALSDTHHWGRSVIEAALPLHLRQALLTARAKETLAHSRSLLDHVASAYTATVNALVDLVRYGKLDKDCWFDGAPRPSDMLRRTEYALQATDTLMPLSKWLSSAEQVRRGELATFVTILEQETAPALALGQLFELSTYLSIGKSICLSVPELHAFDGKAHHRLRDDFRRLDREVIAATGQDCAWQIDSRKVVPEGTRGGRVGELTEMHLLRHQINLQRRHIPIRQLVKRAGRALQSLKPCFMMGPLSVAQYLEPGALKFDLVIMDEASQLRPEDALGAIARGSQLVVVGDPKQLPPTNFFDRVGGGSDDDDDEDEDSTSTIQGMESILDICQQIFTPMRSLRWHYRSQHESLIAFSNHHFYRNLVVFPSPHVNNPRLGVKWRYIRDGVYEDRRNLQEAKRIADAVIWHMKTYPEESLGVVTLNGTQRDLIEELLEHRFKDNDECRAYMDLWEEQGWTFFVKNLENVQGDERDCIMISTTFGKPRGATRVRQNFGPLTTRPDGWRRLNVMFTRAKRRVELFTSMQPEDIVVDEKTRPGTRALRDYLNFAKRGILVSARETDREPDSDFEIAVADVIRSKGYEVRPQLGVAGYFVDLAVRNPDRPGEWLAAIECDGATYHSGLSVRDRDRIRQDILESLGWKDRIYRIWSTDWFYNPLGETAKLISFLESRRHLSAEEQTTERVEFPWEESQDDLDVAPVPEMERDADTKAIEALLEDEAGTVVEDLFVEVGDRVTYCFADAPGTKLSVLIVDSESNPKHNIVNEQTPLAQALFGLGQGGEGTFTAPGQKNRLIRVIKIERQETVIGKMRSAPQAVPGAVSTSAAAESSERLEPGATIRVTYSDGTRDVATYVGLEADGRLQLKLSSGYLLRPQPGTVQIELINEMS